MLVDGVAFRGVVSVGDRLDKRISLVEFRRSHVRKQSWVGVQRWVWDVAKCCAVDLCKNGISWSTSHTKLATAVGQRLFTAGSILEQRNSRIVVWIVELYGCSVDVSSKSHVLEISWPFSRLGAGGVLTQVKEITGNASDKVDDFANWDAVSCCC